MNFTAKLRKYVGTIVAVIGFILLCIITFGDLGEIFGEQYWHNVANNLTAIGFMSVGLVCIQTAIKQGLAEQALQRGLNSERTTEKYDEHKKAIKDNIDRMLYLPYFLQIYNKRHTKLRKREFLVNNNFNSEKMLYLSGNKKLIRQYERILTNVTAVSIKWSTIDIVYDKNGRIMTLDEYRKKRLVKGLALSFMSMIGVTFLTGGLFFTPSGEPLWQKFVKLFVYILSIAITSIFVVIKEYEKGAFGVPNDLDEINQIWYEFSRWDVPEWVQTEVDNLNKEAEANPTENATADTNKDNKEVSNEQEGKAAETPINSGTDLQEKQEEGESISYFNPSGLVPTSFVDSSVLHTNDTEQCGECDGNTEPVGQEDVHGDGTGTELPISGE